MPRLGIISVLAVAVLAIAPARLTAQGSEDVPLGDNAYVYLDALLNRGALRSLSALERPYNVAQIAAALTKQMPANPSPVIKSYERALRRALVKYNVGGLLSGAPRKPGLHYQLGGDVYGTAQSTSIREMMRANDVRGIYAGGGIQGAVQVGPVTAVVHPIWDGRLNADPEYSKLTQSRADPVRLQEGYVDARWKYGEIFVGREGRNSGPSDYDGLLLGNYAYSYDHIYGQVGVPQIHLQWLVTRLNDEQFGDTIEQRYFSWHRIASHIGPVEVAGEESIVYGRPGQSFVLNYVNPVAMYYFTEINEEQGGTNANKMIGMQAAWRSPVGTFSGEFYLNDVQAFSDCTPAVLCEKPFSGGWTVTANGIPLVGDQRLFASYTRLQNLSYRTFEQKWTDYTSYDVSLGRGYADYDEYRLGLDLAAVPAVPLKIYAAYSRQGQGDYRIPFPPPDSFPVTTGFLSGVVSHVYRGAVSGALSLPWIDVSGDIGINHVSNWQHLPGVDHTHFAGSVKFALTWRRIFGGTFEPPPDVSERDVSGARSDQ